MFRYDSKFFRVINKIVDCFYASALWLVFCLPVVTIGASTTALYYTVHKCIKGNRGYVWKSFWGAFKDHIKESIGISVIIEVVFCLVVVDKRLFLDMLNAGSSYGLFYYFFYILQFMILVWGIYIFTYRGRFALDWKNSMKNGAFLAVANLPRTLLIVLILIVAVVIVLISPFFVFLFPALVALLYDYILEPVFRKYMTPEEKEQEKELDMERKR